MKSILKLIVAGVIAVAAAGLAFALQNETIIEWWIPVTACALPAIPAGYLLRKPFCDIIVNSNRWLGGAAAAFFIFTLLIGAFYTINYYGADENNPRQLNAKVTEKITSEHYRTRRVSRNRTVRGEKYNTYSVNVTMPDGRSKILPVSIGQYSRLHAGDNVTLTTCDGLFGVPVIKEKSFKLKHKR
ncbi:MAG: DUF2500 domain-containing protein [Barnesiella sp.]|nr:DUF2500 domain-containing protein [Barnesiella sp.]